MKVDVQIFLSFFFFLFRLRDSTSFQLMPLDALELRSIVKKKRINPAADAGFS